MPTPLFAEVTSMTIESLLTIDSDYGYNIKLEGSFYANSNATILDCAEVVIGNAVLLGPK